MKDHEQQQLKVESELNQLITLQAQLRREIEYTRSHQLSPQDARKKLADVNKRLSRLKKKMDPGRLFDPQIDLFA